MQILIRYTVEAASIDQARLLMIATVAAGKSTVNAVN